MKRSIFVVAAAAGALALPSAAFAQGDTYSNNCGYAATEETSQTVGPATVYVGTGGDAGLAGQSDVAVGACADGLAPNPAGVDGGALEAGGDTTGGQGNYVILDGDNDNNDPSQQSDGYMGLSTFETGNKGTCDDPPGTGTNSGGCFTLDPIEDVARLPLPTACGNTSGSTWANNNRDGCSIP